MKSPELFVSLVEQIKDQAVSQTFEVDFRQCPALFAVGASSSHYGVRAYSARAQEASLYEVPLMGI